MVSHPVGGIAYSDEHVRTQVGMDQFFRVRPTSVLKTHKLNSCPSAANMTLTLPMELHLLAPHNPTLRKQDPELNNVAHCQCQ